MKTFFIVIAIIIGYFIVGTLLDKDKDKNPDKRLLRIDDQFTSAANSAKTDIEKKIIYEKLINKLENITRLSDEDESYRKKLLSILESRIDIN